MFHKLKSAISFWLAENFQAWGMKNLLRHKRMELQGGKRPVRVLFLVADASKWKCQSIFDAMLADSKFEPKIALTVLDEIDTTLPGGPQAKMNALRAFFASRNMLQHTVDAFDVQTGQFLSLHDFNPDVIFYQQAWNVAKNQRLGHTMFFALPCYVPYFSPNYGDIGLDFTPYFHRKLWRYYVSSPEWAYLYRTHANGPQPIGQIVGAGHPIFDELRKYAARYRNAERKHVIYAPHYSFDLPGNENPCNYSTFDKFGKRILEYAQKHPEFKWVFKPHPLLLDAIRKSHLMTEAETDAYFAAWAKIGEVCRDGNYMDLFFQARAMITDSASFLTEFACTEMPIIHLISATAKIHPMKPNKALYDTYYQVHTAEELDATLAAVLEQGRDEKRNARLEELKKCGYMEQNATENILADLKKAFFGE